MESSSFCVAFTFTLHELLLLHCLGQIWIWDVSHAMEFSNWADESSKASDCTLANGSLVISRKYHSLPIFNLVTSDSDSSDNQPSIWVVKWQLSDSGNDSYGETLNCPVSTHTSGFKEQMVSGFEWLPQKEGAANGLQMEVPPISRWQLLNCQ